VVEKILGGSCMDGVNTTVGLQWYASNTSCILNGAERGPSPGGMGTVGLGNMSFKVSRIWGRELLQG
jgi:hypothetical protein